MTKRQSADDLYREGRRFPSAQPHDRRHPLPAREGVYGRHQEVQENQAPEDKHDDKARYENDVPANSWLRSDGTQKPSFDRDNSWRKGRAGSLDWNSGSDPAIIRKPVGEK